MPPLGSGVATFNDTDAPEALQERLKFLAAEQYPPGTVVSQIYRRLPLLLASSLTDDKLAMKHERVLKINAVPGHFFNGSPKIHQRVASGVRGNKQILGSRGMCCVD